MTIHAVTDGKAIDAPFSVAQRAERMCKIVDPRVPHIGNDGVKAHVLVEFLG